MIPEDVITGWSLTRPWQSRADIEQDMLLAVLITEIYQHPVLREELVFRGGTCLHQVCLSQPLRYSEDLDFVRRTHSGIGPVFDGLREVAQRVGVEVRGTHIGTHPKVRIRARAETSGTPLNIKIEMNTQETSPVLPLRRVPFGVETAWYRGQAEVLTFAVVELVSTKLRALFQRTKGRDLFDLWIALTQLELSPEGIVAAFGPYRPDGYCSARAIENLRAKQADVTFRADIVPLVASWPPGYDIDGAVDLVIEC